MDVLFQGIYLTNIHSINLFETSHGHNTKAMTYMCIVFKTLIFTIKCHNYQTLTGIAAAVFLKY